MIRKVGYAVLSASGRTLKLYVDGQFVGLLSLSDVDRCRKTRRFAASIVDGGPDGKPGAQEQETG